MTGNRDRSLLSHDVCPDMGLLALPERVLQIGEGNFLRGFVDWMIHGLNQHDLFRGRIVVVAPRTTGAPNIDRLNRQDGLFTVWLRGVQQGVQVEEREIVSSVSRGIDPYQHWGEFLGCAENPEIDIVVSNTTESGIQYTPEDFKSGTPVQSFPGKLTAYLYHRYCHFDGAASAGMTIVPCELIDNNGDKLREIVLHHADDWQLPRSFTEWVQSHNHFCNTLVDRIVTGFPQGEDADDLLSALPYRDELVTVGEPFHLWVIEADERLKSAWPFEKIGMNAHYVTDVTPYRIQKVRILNGAHTAMCALGLLSGLQTVGEVMDQPILGLFVRRLIDEEIVPTLLASVPAIDKATVEEFAGSVVDRFRNPFVHHELNSITLNGLSKIRVRLIPTLYEYYQNRKQVPALLAASIAAQLLFYRNADSHTERWIIRDDPEMVQMIADIWREEAIVGLEATISMLLGTTELWSQDLNEIDGLREGIAVFIHSVRTHGIIAALESVVRQCGQSRGNVAR